MWGFSVHFSFMGVIIKYQNYAQKYNIIIIWKDIFYKTINAKLKKQQNWKLGTEKQQNWKWDNWKAAKLKMGN